MLKEYIAQIISRSGQDVEIWKVGDKFGFGFRLRYHNSKRWLPNLRGGYEYRSERQAIERAKTI